MSTLNRRRFLGLLSSVAATPVVKPLMKLLPAPPIEVKQVAVIGSYADYTNYTDFALDSVIDGRISALATYYSSSLMDNLKKQTPGMEHLAICRPMPEGEKQPIVFYSYPLDKNEHL